MAQHIDRIPKSWYETSLDAVGDVVTGNTPARKNPDYYGGSIPFIKPGDIPSNAEVTRVDEFLSEDGAKKARVLKQKSVMVTCIGNLGRVGWSKKRVATNQQINAVEFNELVDPKYGFYSCCLLRPWLEENAAATTVSIINKSKFSTAPFYLAPLPEQKRIVEKLDSLLAQVDTIQQRLNNLPDIIKRFRQSVLAAAVSGKLTEKWRDENSTSESSEELLERWLKERKERFNAEQLKLVSEEKIKRPRKFKEPSLPDLEKRNLELPYTWTLVSVSQFSDCLDYIRVPVKKDDRNSAKGLYPYFGANGIVDYVDDYLFDDELVLVTEDETFYGRTKPIAFRSSGKCWVNNHAHVLRAVTKIASEYLCYSLMHYDVQPWLSGSTGRAKLGQAALNELPIGLPPETEIIEVVRVIEQYFALADTLEKNLANAKQRVDNLTQSILAKAFRGELVPQDPNDEPADKLLARIKAARLEAEKLEKAAKKAAKASKK